MRIGIPVRNGRIFGHFGNAPSFLLVDMEDGRVTNRTEIVPEVSGHGVYPAFLAEQGVTHVIADCIGRGALEKLAAHGIQVVAGVKGSPDEALARFAAGTLEEGPNPCKEHHHHHGHHHDHDHHHHDHHHHGHPHGHGGDAGADER